MELVELLPVGSEDPEPEPTSPEPVLDEDSDEPDADPPSEVLPPGEGSDDPGVDPTPPDPDDIDPKLAATVKVEVIIKNDSMNAINMNILFIFTSPPL